MAAKIDRIKAREQDPKVRAHNFQEVCYGYNAEEALQESTRCLHCKNPRCVTSVETYFDHVFHLVNKEKRSYRCEYCDDIVIPYPNK